MNEKDRFLYEAVLEAIEDVELIRQARAPVEVTVEDGVVTLEGVVMSGQMHRMALTAAAATPGVVKVIDKIYEDRLLEIAVAAHLATDEELDALRPSLIINSYRGLVTLTGHVPDERLIGKALALAEGVRGVRSVESEITVGEARV